MGRLSKVIFGAVLLVGAFGGLGGCGCGCGCGCGEDPAQKGYSDEEIRKAQERVKRLEEQRPATPKAPEENAGQVPPPQ